MYISHTSVLLIKTCTKICVGVETSRNKIINPEMIRFIQEIQRGDSGAPGFTIRVYKDKMIARKGNMPQINEEKHQLVYSQKGEE